MSMEYIDYVSDFIITMNLVIILMQTDILCFLGPLRSPLYPPTTCGFLTTRWGIALSLKNIAT